MNYTPHILATPIDPARAAAQVATLRAMWAELHAWPVNNQDLSKWPKWFAAWSAKVPSYGCDCALHWQRIVAATPPDATTTAALFGWTVDAHNQVNRILGKPQMPVAAAEVLYKFAA